MLNGLRHGFGTFRSADGKCSYQGEWCKGRKHGKVKLGKIMYYYKYGELNHFSSFHMHVYYIWDTIIYPVNPSGKPEVKVCEACRDE